LEARRPLNGSPYHEAFPSSAYPAGAGAAAGLLARGKDETGVSGTSVERFADSSFAGGVLEGVAGAGCRLTIGLRPAHPEPTRANENKVVETK
jgi:hypothetical protein